MTDAERIADLERRIAELERKLIDQLPNPLGPYRPHKPAKEPTDWDRWPDLPPNHPGRQPWEMPVEDEGTTCPACHMQWKGVMGYVCPRVACPMSAGPTICSTTTR